MNDRSIWTLLAADNKLFIRMNGKTWYSSSMKIVNSLPILLAIPQDAESVSCINKLLGASQMAFINRFEKVLGKFKILSLIFLNHRFLLTSRKWNKLGRFLWVNMSIEKGVRYIGVKPINSLNFKANLCLTDLVLVPQLWLIRMLIFGIDNFSYKILQLWILVILNGWYLDFTLLQKKTS